MHELWSSTSYEPHLLSLPFVCVRRSGPALDLAELIAALDAACGGSAAAGSR